MCVWERERGRKMIMYLWWSTCFLHQCHPLMSKQTQTGEGKWRTRVNRRASYKKHALMQPSPWWTPSTLCLEAQLHASNLVICAAAFLSKMQTTPTQYWGYGNTPKNAERRTRLWVPPLQLFVPYFIWQFTTWSIIPEENCNNHCQVIL